MPPRTRRQAAVTGCNPPAEDAGSSNIEQLLHTALQGVTKLRKENTRLDQENMRLKEDLDRIYQAQDVSIQPKPGKKGNVSVLSLTAHVNKLKRQVAELEDARKKDKKRIRRLQRKEIQRDAMELGNELEYGVQDEILAMKKLLRRFGELVSAPSMEEKEECAVCLTEMTLESARSLPCGHVFCLNCLPNIDPPNCPNCREPFDSAENTEVVQFTATEQWDALLDVAAEWGRLDRGESLGETTEQEDELPFIEDDLEENATSSEHDFGNEYNAVDEDTPHNEGQPPATPSGSRIRRPASPPASSTVPPDGHASQSSQPNPPSTPTRDLPSPVSYQSSPSSVKRRRMKELAEARMSKRTRL